MSTKIEREVAHDDTSKFFTFHRTIACHTIRSRHAIRNVGSAVGCSVKTDTDRNVVNCLLNVMIIS